MLTRFVLGFCFIAAMVPGSQGQVVSTASRRADLQAGAGYVNVQPDYGPGSFKGWAIYTTLDLTNHLGGEFVLHQANTSTNNSLYERTYEIGPRYTRHYGRFSPYVKGMYGRGVFNFQFNVANLAYNIFAGGVGTDFRVLPYLNVRADFEYQDWLSFPPQGLKPEVFMVGVAYHFPGGLRQGRHF